MKGLKIFLYTTLLFIVLAAVAIIALGFFVNPDRLKQIIAATLKQETGYEVTVDGPCSWSFYPALGVKISHIAFALPSEKTAFVDLHGVTFETPFRALLHGKLGTSHFYVSHAHLFDLLISNIRVGLTWKNQQLSLTPITASFYDGQLQGAVIGKDIATSPTWQVHLEAHHVALQPLLEAVNGGKVSVTGAGDVTLAVTARGKTRDQVVNSLDGTATFEVA